jgi:hypothetical protein
VATAKSGRPTAFNFVPVSDRAVGLEQLRVLLRRDPEGFRRRLIRLGWMAEEQQAPSSRPSSRRNPGARLGSAG